MRKLTWSAVCIVLVSLMLWTDSRGLAATKPTEVEDLRRELERTQTQLKELTTQMQELQERLQQVEATKDDGEPVTPPPLETPSRSAMLQVPLGQRQLLLDLGVTGDFVAAFAEGEEKTPQGAGTFPGRENRVFPRVVELGLTGRVDPYARADFYLEFAEEGEIEATDGGFDVGRQFEVGIDEAYVTLLQLPLGLQARGGQMRPKFGRLNVVHQHDLPQVDRPDVLVNFFGEEGESEIGAELSGLLPTPFFQELSIGVYNGDNQISFGKGEITDPLVTAYLRNFFELSNASALQVGLSGQTGPNEQGERTVLAGLDLTYKWTPLEQPYTALTLQGEGLYSHHETKADDKDRFGAYVFGDYRFSRRWGVGTRVDWSEFPIASGREWAVAPYLNFWLSDFLRFRLQYKHTDRNFAGNLDEVFLQTVFTLGHHPPHEF
ncbi:MAG: hypothetical protein ACE5JQ_15385 [Candidatus Methylomirabilales bacterium]